MKMGSNYVEDSRLAAETMAPGTRYDNFTKSFIWRPPNPEEDCVQNSQEQVLAALN